MDFSSSPVVSKAALSSDYDISEINHDDIAFSDLVETSVDEEKEVGLFLFCFYFT